MELRPYQQDAVDKIVDYFYSPVAVPKIYVAPVAAGKSIIIASVVKKLGGGVLVLQPSKELLEQNYSKYTLLGGKASIYSASVGVKEVSEVTFATLKSIKKDVDRLKNLGIKYLIIDEVHYGYPYKKGTEFYNFIKEFKPTHCIGLTATPVVLTSKAVNGEYITQLDLITNHFPRYFKEFLDIIQVSEMVKNNYWSPLEYVKYEINTEKLVLNSSGRDFTEESILLNNIRNNVNNNIYLLIKKIMDSKKGILVFMDNVENAKKMASFLGTKAACVHGGTPKKERTQIINDFKAGKIKVVTNHGVLTTGFDHPELDTIILGRPTSSFSLFYQMVGRGTRLADGKDSCQIIDFGNNIKRFGTLEEIQIEYLPKHGLQVTIGDNLITGYPLGYGVKKKDPERPTPKYPKMTFGKYKGLHLDVIPLNYLSYLLNVGIVDKGSEFYEPITKRLNENN